MKSNFLATEIYSTMALQIQYGNRFQNNLIYTEKSQ